MATVPIPVVIEAGETDSGRLLDMLEMYGCALVREALPLAVLEAVARRANAHFFRASFAQTNAELVALDTVPTPALSSTLRAAGGTVDDFSAALATSRPWRALQSLYSGLSLSVLQSRMRLARPGDDPNSVFQQWASSARQRNLGFTFWIPLGACGEEAPSLEVVARRARARPGAKETSSVSFADLSADQRSAIWSPEMELGDLLVIDPLTLYRDAPRSEMRQTRIALDCRILRPPG
jgi:hypothetical protein